MKYLVNTTEVYRFDTEDEANAFVREAKKSGQYILASYSCVHKEIKSKGEILDEYFLLTLKKLFNDPKEPTDDYDIIYEVKD